MRNKLLIVLIVALSSPAQAAEWFIVSRWEGMKPSPSGETFRIR
jgi:hypothetical protein